MQHYYLGRFVYHATVFSLHVLSYLVLPLKARSPAVASLPSSPRWQGLRSSTQVLTLRQDISQPPLLRYIRPCTGWEGIWSRGADRPGHHAESAGARRLLDWKWIRKPGGRWGAWRGKGGFVWNEGFWRREEGIGVKKWRLLKVRNEWVLGRAQTNIRGNLLSTWAKAQNGPLGQLPHCCMSLHLVDL